ncbi:cadherin-related family member 2 [Alosa alosa]|nr:cadherin-related family member 2 [Alosa alosa]XP_048087137.1 cadherin-related family member 2 [Alosa alosa]
MGQVTIISFLLLVTLTAKVHCNTVPEIVMTTLIRIREDTRTGVFAFQINATDADGDKLVYGLSGPDSNFFNADAGTGRVTVRLKLDREVKDVLTFKVTVTDNVYFPVSKVINVILIDANDNFPIFQGTPYNVKIPENKPIGSSIFHVTAGDTDLGSAGAVSYSLSGVSPPDGEGLFAIQSTGIISLTGELSFTEKSTFYQLNVTAKDGGGPLGDDPQHFEESSTFVFLTVEDVPNLDPQFSNLPSAANVAEGAVVGTTVFIVRARDPDAGVNSPILYSIKSSSVDDLFQIDPNSGVITVRSLLDREQYLDSDGVVTLEIEAKETKPDVNNVNAVTNSELHITITDLNDEMPEFYSCTPESCAIQKMFTGNINEHSAVGLPVLGINMTVIDKDKGENSKFSLSIEGQGKDAFSISPVLAISSANVQILMRSPADVDYEKTTSITLTVIAVDPNKEEFKSTATVTIAINNINDNSPKFQSETYKLTVEEHSPAGTEIAIITATDDDKDDAGKIVYRLLPESVTEYFTVDPATGKITVRDGDRLDREGQSFYTATLQAKDQANNTGTANLEITLLDKNDNAPQIRETYIAYVKEGPGVDFEMKIRATDFDQPNTNNSKIEYQIVPDEFSNYFKLDQDTGVLTLNGPLDREALDPSLNGVIELNVTAFDKGTPPLGTWVKVEINVEDINDNEPLFKQKEYTFTVKESEQGAFINSVLAKDLDQTVQNNRISFRITGGGAGTFSVRSIQAPDNAGYWGNISVDQDSALDYETRKKYTFTVEALDPEQQTDTATVHLNVEDVNDETPSLSTGIVMLVTENTTIVGGKVGVIVGKDVDTNHELKYELLSTECPCNETGVCQEEWFLVEPSGQVMLNPEYVVDYEMCAQVLLHVQVTDVLTELGKNSSEGTITIEIKDINDNAPEFIQVQPNFVVLAESTEKGTSVASVSATDRDTDPENIGMTFEVLEVKFVSNNNQTEGMSIIFQAEDQPQTSTDRLAIIKSLQSLDPKKKGKYVVTVQVKNINDGLSSTSDVVIFTVDQSFRVSLEFRVTVSEFNENQAIIKWALESATGTTVHIVKISGQTEQRATPLTVVDTYFIYPNGTALKHDTVLNMVNGNPNTEFRDTLSQNGLSGVNAGVEENQGEVNTELYILMGLAGGLVIVLVVMTTLLVFMRRNYTRKLKAAKAMNSATNAILDNQKSGPVVPGTNKYTREGANPVLNLNIDTTTDLGFDEEDSNADRSSLNSLDYNIDMNMSEKDTMPMMVIEEEEEENGYDNNSYYEPLGAALAQRGKKRGTDSPSLSFTEPTPSTTDL